tara:strand:+ start:145 stop:321 length:177 start_codon:yes stop_codon:yes gene_type:complete
MVRNLRKVLEDYALLGTILRRFRGARKWNGIYADISAKTHRAEHNTQQQRGVGKYPAL